ncbi:MAG: tetratricopeptide repeat protein [Ignavibacteriaceae bacterium]|nr:tetratricopeptide repeat protein [Ignavibacteriaceae bacterium]
MKFSLPENTLLQLSEFIASNLALNFPKERWNDLERNIVSASNEFGYKEVESFIQRIMSSPLTHEHIEILTAHLTNNETYFWREHKTFEVLEQKILPELIQIRKEEKRIRIWSAGCSTGEEPYSIAIALNRSIPNIKDWNITILATDISPRILRKATAGIYSQWSFRNSPQWLKENYFLPTDNNKFELIPRIKDIVKFEYLNLADDVFPSPLNNTNAMDIIFCRNVLMYFTQDRFRQVSRGLYNSLVQGGYFVVSASELSTQNFPEFMPVNVPGMVIYQKTSKKMKDRYKLTFVDPPPEPIPFQIPPKPFHTIEWMKPQPTEVANEIANPEEIPKQIDPIYQETLKSFAQGDYAEVIDKLQNDEQTVDERILLIRALANQGKLIEALKTCEDTITKNKLDPRLYYLYATILQENNQLNEAVASLKRAIYLDTNFVLSYYLLGNVYQRLGDVKSAKKSYEIVLSLLNKCSKDEILFESEGLTAGRFKEIIKATMQTRELV